MDSFTLDFGLLAQQTMDINRERVEELLDGTFITEYPETSGVIYTLQKGRGTFGIRGVAVVNIATAIEQIHQQQLYWHQLRIKDEAELSNIEFFETSSYEGAEILVDTMMNRRFPYQEDIVCNISDPGFSWWGNFSGTSFQIYFLSHQVERSGELVRLGPIGDRRIAAKRFQQFLLLFSQYIQQEDFICTEKMLSYSVEKVSGSFFDLKNLFFLGEFSPTLKTLLELDKTLYYYFEELATARKFWLEIEKKIASEVEQSSFFFA